MKNKLLFSLLLSFVLFSAVTFGQQLKFAKDGMAILKGKRTFMIGLYETPENDRILKQVSEAGFTIVAVPFKDSVATKMELDKLSSAGLGAWISGPFDLSLNAEKGKNKLMTMVRNFGSHSALLAWEVPDEALWNVSTKAYDYRTGKEIKLFEEAIKTVKDSDKRKAFEAKVKEISAAYTEADIARGQEAADALWLELGKKIQAEDFSLIAAPQRSIEVANGIKSGYDYVKSIDPFHHPVFMNHAPRNQIAKLALYNRAADIVGCDIYPFPEYKTEHSDLVDHSLASVGGYTQRMRQSAPGKPVWMVLQGFGWGDYFMSVANIDKREELPPPALSQTRFMAFDAIVNGARGVNYWGTYIADKETKIWKDILAIAHELKELQPVLSALDAKIKPEITLEESFNSFDQSIKVLPKQMGKEIWFIVVNENRNKNTVVYNLNKLNRLNGLVYQEQLSGKTLLVVNGTVRFPIGGYGVHILKPIGR